MLRVEKILGALNKNKVRYLLIGGLASILYGVPRTTIDIDIAIAPRKKDITLVLEAFSKLGLVPDISSVDEILASGGTTFSNGRSVDVLTSLPKFEFKELWKRRETVIYKQAKLNVIALKDHVQILRRIGRKQDLEDLEILEGLK